MKAIGRRFTIGSMMIAIAGVAVLLILPAGVGVLLAVAACVLLLFAGLILVAVTPALIAMKLLELVERRATSRPRSRKPLPIGPDASPVGITFLEADDPVG